MNNVLTTKAGKQIHAYFHSLSITDMVSFRTQPIVFLYSVTMCSFLWKTPSYLNLASFLYGNVFHSFRAMLNPLWLACSIIWSHNKNAVILSSSNNYSFTEKPHSITAQLKGGKSSSPGIAQRQLDLHFMTGTSCMLGAHRQFHSCEQKYKQDLLHQPWGHLLWTQRTTSSRQPLGQQNTFGKKCKCQKESKFGIISPLQLTWFMSIQVAWDMVLFSKGKLNESQDYFLLTLLTMGLLIYEKKPSHSISARILEKQVKGIKIKILFAKRWISSKKSGFSLLG